MTWRTTETVSTVRASADDPRMVEGIAIPYGQVATATEIGAEAFAPGAFRESVDYWTNRTDGAKLPFRAAHGSPVVGSVQEMADTPEGVRFRARIRAGAAGDAYLADVADGINGVSIEFAASRDRSTRTKEGLTLHRAAKLYAIAGSVSPAYDGARISLRDMEEPSVTDETTTTEAASVTRSAAEKNDPIVQKLASSSITITRPELVYGRTSEYNWLRDSWLATKGDGEAFGRQEKHRGFLSDTVKLMEREAASRLADPILSSRAGDLLQSEIPGALPPDFVPGLLTPRILKGRVMGDFYQRYPISDTRPRTFAKVTTSGTVTVQSAEGAALGTTDIATTAVTATPLMYGATIDVSRQVLDSADPAALSMVYQDLIEAYAQASETVIKTAVEAGASASGTAITAATPWVGVLGNVIKYYSTRFKAAEAAFIPSALYAVLLAQGDTTGRPFMPQLGYMNSDGSALAGGISGNVLGAKASLSYASTVNVCVFGRSSDYVIYESPLATIQYDQVVGPQAVRVGLWAYLAVGTRLGSLSVTAA